ncbi:MAG TPA: YebC/PmpR family DNA-binding transcriptional regulator [Bacteroidales bacterium]|mgnify:FL=1|jgi:YebC/PmpR family DNA-binding regulatory protein|nr:YebC/PmpR family DNA-binding transcriptional regulator [Bacteroidales bacterium]MDI9574160.1 YebC/PmpR family DNA-binding transcriptional regulator [Bacteroidota bacterium]OQC61043.1 MAG: putative transcriptional regulatory protein [Bacteroidetes bacterium ADurb.Bin012]MBP9512470.1 YebC/PmpR family DNA-binding transcriptional regulator [Bacteroidales bacterium]MBP9589364.1 YebC/PmpR family DNA-binding transcriptional regulator [Bacteroidales bacterium]
MSGHNKWSTIKRKKGALDTKRSKMFSKIIKEITVAVKENGPDPESNPRLRLAIANAKGVSMPKENILRAINKGSDKDAANFQETTYEGYISGVAVFIECTTDNVQRTVSNIRSIFNKFGGSLGVNGSLAHIFERKGIFTIPISQIKDMEEFELEVIDAGAEDIDVDEENGIVTINTAMEDFGSMIKKLESLHIDPENAQLQRIPVSTIEVDPETAKKLLRVIDLFEEDDDVQNVYHNMSLTDEILASFE